MLTLLAIVAFFGWFLVAVAAGDVEVAVDFKGNTPYCRRCHRQVSFKRPVCRSCGASLYAPKAPTAPPDVAILRAAERVHDEQIREDVERWRLEHERQRADREAERSAHRATRDASYRDRGIEPGPLAWFRALPELAQAILLGVAFAAPAGGLAWAIFSSR